MEIFNLIDHLKRCPEELLLRIGVDPDEDLHTQIIVMDTYRRVFGNFSVADSQLPELPNLWELDENHIYSIQIGCWLFTHPYFARMEKLLPSIRTFLFYDLAKVSSLVKYREWIDDEDRCEEFIRLALKRCDIIPNGETAQIASDRLDALDTIKRQQVLSETNQSIERVKEIRRQMAEKKSARSGNRIWQGVKNQQ